ncbi:TPA: hypothetical protein N0F65_009416 [Lagenidium giganteum]|uniref:Uncharacterized protein n=1 Tax=Lagenidium giganteum TaxID=4803 RepID=A0AAV2ZFY5_9STRA|nr:TPA: hypothetical protein N0F65_009416 [Lagenidium giganteum]
MAMPLPLEGDGLIENLFYFLWCKDDFGSGPSIFIPHTVLYKSTQPSAWYFTSRKSGKIKRKAKINLNNAQIEHALTKRKSATDVVAYHLYLNDHNNAIIEYFDIAALQEFLYRREKTHNGLLQQFVLPKGTSHATIRAIWSPKICLLERRINHKNLYDKRFSVYERAVTFDGADLHSRPEPVRGAMLPGEIQRLCEQVVDHVTQVSYHKYRISRMVLHLKVDADDKIWLLWCSSLRLLNLHALSNASTPIVPRPLDMVSDATVPTHINFRHHHHLDDAQKDEKRRGFVLCTSCGKLTDQTKMLSTNYKAVLEHFARFLSFLRVHVNEMEQTAIEWPPDERLVQAAGGVGFGILPHIERPAGGGGKANRTTTLTPKELVVPPVIQYLHPNLSAQDLERHRTDPIFLHKPVPVCESCCLVYADFTTSALEVNTLRISASVPLIMRPQREVSELRKRLDPLESIELTARGVPGSSPKSTAKKKPPASAWKPIPSSTTTDRQQIKRKVLPTALSNLPTAPQLPLRIDKLDEIAAHSPALSLFLQTEDVGPEKDMRKREESFFRDLYHDKDLEKHHPLHHMLESATRLSHAKKDLHSIKTHMGKTQQHTQSMSALPDVQVKKAFKSPYRVVQRLPDERGEPTKAATTIKHRSKGRQATKNKTGATAHASDAVAEGDEHDEDEGDDGGNKRAMRFISTRENRASKDYQDFLFAALSDAQAQVS